MTYVALDGDSVGDLVEQVVLAGDAASVRRASRSVSRALTVLRRRVRQQGARLVFAAGDSLLCELDDQSARALALDLYSKATTPTFSYGLGVTMRHAWLALKYAKTMKPAIVVFDRDRFVVLAGSEDARAKRPHKKGK